MLSGGLRGHASGSPPSQLYVSHPRLRLGSLWEGEVAIPWTKFTSKLNLVPTRTFGSISFWIEFPCPMKAKVPVGLWKWDRPVPIKQGSSAFTWWDECHMLFPPEGLDFFLEV